MYTPVLEYEKEQKGRTEKEIWAGLKYAYRVMNEAVETGLTEETISRSGMINNGGKKVAANTTSVLGPEFQQLIARTLAAKEVNSCMGKVVAAPTAGCIRHPARGAGYTTKVPWHRRIQDSGGSPHWSRHSFDHREKSFAGWSSRWLSG